MAMTLTFPCFCCANRATSGALAWQAPQRGWKNMIVVGLPLSLAKSGVPFTNLAPCADAATSAVPRVASAVRRRTFMAGRVARPTDENGPCHESLRVRPRVWYIERQMSPGVWHAPRRISRWSGRVQEPNQPPGRRPNRPTVQTPRPPGLDSKHARQDSNLRPLAPEASALSTELRALDIESRGLGRKSRRSCDGCDGSRCGVLGPANIPDIHGTLRPGLVRSRSPQATSDFRPSPLGARSGRMSPHTRRARGHRG